MTVLSMSLGKALLLTRNREQSEEEGRPRANAVPVKHPNLRPAKTNWQGRVRVT